MHTFYNTKKNIKNKNIHVCNFVCIFTCVFQYLTEFVIFCMHFYVCFIQFDAPARIHVCHFVCIFTCVFQYLTEFVTFCMHFYRYFLQFDAPARIKNVRARFSAQSDGKVCFATGQGPESAYYAGKVAKGAKVPGRAAGGQDGGKACFRQF